MVSIMELFHPLQFSLGWMTYRKEKKIQDTARYTHKRQHLTCWRRLSLSFSRVLFSLFSLLYSLTKKRQCLLELVLAPVSTRFFLFFFLSFFLSFFLNLWFCLTSSCYADKFLGTISTRRSSTADCSQQSFIIVRFSSKFTLSLFFIFIDFFVCVMSVLLLSPTTCERWELCICTSV